MIGDQLEQGEVFDADFGILAKTGKANIRPCIIAGRDELIGGNDVLVVPTTAKRVTERARLRNFVRFEPGGQAGFSKVCVAQTHLIQPIPKSHLLSRRGKLTPKQIASLRDSVAWTVGLKD